MPIREDKREEMVKAAFCKFKQERQSLKVSPCQSIQT